MKRPGRINLTPHQKVQAEICETARARFNPAIQAAIETEDTITIYDAIGEGMFSEGVTVNRIDAALRKIGNKDVTVLINSPGGDVFEGIAIYNRLREHPANVTVKVMGLAASAASIIAMAGDQIQIGQASFLMIHNAWVVAMGNKGDLRDVAEFLEPFDAALADVYSARSGVDRAEITAMMDRETWLNGSQAIEAGLADALLPADEIEEGEAPKANAVRTVEHALTREANFSRSQARALINEIKGKPDAALEPMQDAGGTEWLPDAAAFVSRLRA